VTEYGIAYLHGKSVRERVLQLINIAHPDFREELLEQAKKWNYVFSDQILPKSIEGRISIYPDKYETYHQLTNGKKIKIRPIKPTDERMLQELYYSLDEQDRYLRFFAPITEFRHQKVQYSVNIDYTTDMVLVGEYSEDSNKRIVAIGGFFKTNKPEVKELAFTVHKKWRGNGITTFLLNYLVTIARELNCNSFTGSIILENRSMLNIISKSNYPLKYKKIEGGVIDFLMDITKK